MATNYRKDLFIGVVVAVVGTLLMLVIQIILSIEILQAENCVTISVDIGEPLAIVFSMFGVGCISSHLRGMLD